MPVDEEYRRKLLQSRAVFQLPEDVRVSLRPNKYKISSEEANEAINCIVEFVNDAQENKTNKNCILYILKRLALGMGSTNAAVVEAFNLTLSSILKTHPNLTPLLLSVLQESYAEEAKGKVTQPQLCAHIKVYNAMINSGYELSTTKVQTILKDLNVLEQHGTLGPEATATAHMLMNPVCVKTECKEMKTETEVKNWLQSLLSNEEEIPKSFILYSEELAYISQNVNTISEILKNCVFEGELTIRIVRLLTNRLVKSKTGLMAVNTFLQKFEFPPMIDGEKFPIVFTIVFAAFKEILSHEMPESDVKIALNSLITKIKYISASDIKVYEEFLTKLLNNVYKIISRDLQIWFVKETYGTNSDNAFKLTEFKTFSMQSFGSFIYVIEETLRNAEQMSDNGLLHCQFLATLVSVCSEASEWKVGRISSIFLTAVCQHKKQLVKKINEEEKHTQPQCMNTLWNMLDEFKFEEQLELMTGLNKNLKHEASSGCSIIACKKSKKLNKSNEKIKVFLALYNLIGLLAHFDEEKFVEILNDVQSCEERALQNKEGNEETEKHEGNNETGLEEPHWCDVILEVLLDLLTYQHAFYKQYCKHIFRNLVPFIGSSGVQIILNGLDLSKERELFNVNEENEESEDDESDAENDESEEDEDNDDEEDGEEEIVDMSELQKLQLEMNAVVGGEDVDMDTLSQEEMDNLDEKLGLIFKNYKAKIKAKRPQKKSPYELHTLQVFRIRMCDLLHIYIEQSSLSDSLNLIIPIVECARKLQGKEQHKQLQSKLLATFSNICKRNSFAAFETATNDDLIAILQRVLQSAKQYPASMFKHLGHAIEFLLRISNDLKGEKETNVVVNFFITQLEHVLKAHSKSSMSQASVLKCCLQSCSSTVILAVAETSLAVFCKSAGNDSRLSTSQCTALQTLLQCTRRCKQVNLEMKSQDMKNIVNKFMARANQIILANCVLHEKDIKRDDFILLLDTTKTFAHIGGNNALIWSETLNAILVFKEKHAGKKKLNKVFGALESLRKVIQNGREGIHKEKSQSGTEEITTDISHLDLQSKEVKNILNPKRKKRKKNKNKQVIEKKRKILED